jgi:hypothetical protein
MNNPLIKREELELLKKSQSAFAAEFPSAVLNDLVSEQIKKGLHHPLWRFTDTFYIDELNYRFCDAPQMSICPKCGYEFFTVIDGNVDMSFICPKCNVNLQCDVSPDRCDENDWRIFNTCQFGYAEVKEKDSNYFERIKNKLLYGGAKRGKNISAENISATLGELRCYGYLINAINKANQSIYKGSKIKSEAVTPSNKVKTPDFRISKGGSEVFIEVATFNASNAYWPAEKEFALALQRQVETDGNRVSITEHTNSPYNKRKDDDGTLIHATIEEIIHKIAPTKQGAEQSVSGKPFVLWFDYQDEAFSGVDGFELNADAVQISKGTYQISFTSSPIWYALYGRKGMRIFQYSSRKKDCDKRRLETTIMQHEGKFYDVHTNNTQVSAVIISSPYSTAIFENPNAEVQLPEWFFKVFRELHNCNYGCCVIGGKRQVQNDVKTDSAFIKSLSKIKLYTR